MRRFAGIAAVLFLLLLPLAACGGAEEKAGFDPEITLQALADAGAFSEELEELDGDTAFTLYGLGNSGLEREDLTTVLRSCPSWRAPSSSSGRTLCCCWWPATWRRLRACWSSKGR